MKQGRTDQDWVIVSIMAFGVGTLLTWALVSEGFAWPRLSVEQGAAWVQAIGSILAILLAIAVPAIQHSILERRRRLESDDRARSMGLLLLPHIREFAEKSRELWKHENPDADGYENYQENGGFAGSRTLNALEIPPAISASIAEIHHLGSAANGLQQAIYGVIAAKKLIERKSFTEFKPYLRTSTVDNFIRDKKAFYDLMFGVLEGLNSSQTKIEAKFPVGARPMAIVKK